MVVFSISIQTKLCRLLLYSVLFTQMLYLATGGGVCENGPSKTRFEYWKGDDESVKGKTTPQALIFENVMIRGNIVLMCDVSRALAREVSALTIEDASEPPSWPFLVYELPMKKKVGLKETIPYLWGGKRLHRSLLFAKCTEECNLDPATFGTTSHAKL